MTDTQRTSSTKKVVTSRGIAIALVYGCAIFSASFLMFLIEPYQAKRFLPFLGGSANVWNTCVVFYQLTLIAGYLYAHIISRQLARKTQLLIHVPLFWLAAAVFLRVRLTPDPSFEHPYMWLFATLLLSIGPVFLAVSTCAPLLQKWYRNTGGLGATDPYFLYSISNAGGLLGLLTYPLWVEPNLGMRSQSQLVSGSYLLVALLVTTCGLMSAFGNGKRETSGTNGSDEVETTTQFLTIDGKLALKILILCLIPSSLFLGLTTYVTSELSAIPFFWVCPLVIYLLSFIIAFARTPGIVERLAKLLAPIFLLLSLVILVNRTLCTNTFGEGVGVTTGLSVHLISLFLTCVAMHCRVAALRPDPGKLTGFYLFLSIGGALGAMFNTLLAPILLPDWLEFPIMIVAAIVILIAVPSKRQLFSETGKSPWTMALAVAATLAVSYTLLFALVSNFSSVGLALGAAIGVCLLAFVPASATCLIFGRSELQTRIGLGAVGICFLLFLGIKDPYVVHRERDFYGCISVRLNSADNTCEFWSGATLHGSESLDPELRGKPTSYFHSKSPIGVLLKTVFKEDTTSSTTSSTNLSRMVANRRDRDPIAVIGLGCGTLASYAVPKQKLFFYEIDPAVTRIASNPFFFSYVYLARKRGVDLRIIEGDGRLMLNKAPYRFFRLILLDAFSSDSIPVHLVTKEAAELYLSRLKDGGALAYQVTNNYYDLKPALAVLADDLKLHSAFLNDYRVARYKIQCPSEWVVLSKNEVLIRTLKQQGWKDLPDRRSRLWTDDYCNPLGLLTSPFS